MLSVNLRVILMHAFVGYAMTETSGVIAKTPGQEDGDHMPHKSSGVPVPGCEIKVI